MNSPWIAKHSLHGYSSAETHSFWLLAIEATDAQGNGVNNYCAQVGGIV